MKKQDRFGGKLLLDLLNAMRSLISAPNWIFGDQRINNRDFQVAVLELPESQLRK